MELEGNGNHKKKKNSRTALQRKANKEYSWSHDNYLYLLSSYRQK
jgi:hypothetical protein